MRLKKTSIAAKLLILAICAFALVSLVGLRGEIQEKRAQAEELRKQVMYAEQEQRELEEDMSKLGSDESIIKIASERLGMVFPGDIRFYDSDGN